jgi:hypothetical protein
MEQSNIIIAFLYRLLSLYRQFEPWSQIVSVAVLIVGLYLVSRRFVKIRITRAK